MVLEFLHRVDMLWVDAHHDEVGLKVSEEILAARNRRLGLRYKPVVLAQPLQVVMQEEGSLNQSFFFRRDALLLFLENFALPQEAQCRLINCLKHLADRRNIFDLQLPQNRSNRFLNKQHLEHEYEVD